MVNDFAVSGANLGRFGGIFGEVRRIAAVYSSFIQRDLVSSHGDTGRLSIAQPGSAAKTCSLSPESAAAGQA
jgi:hypothetical protein